MASVSKILLIIECVICSAEIMAVLIIDSIVMTITVNGASKTGLYFFAQAVMCMLGIHQKEELIIFLSLHLAVHVVWLMTLIFMVAGMFLFQPKSGLGFTSFFISACVVSLLDLVSTIYFGIQTSKVYAGCSKSLFFPLYFCKGILLWITNLVIAVHVLICGRQVGNTEIEIGLSRTATVYCIPWDSHTELLIPPPSPPSPVAMPPEVPQPRSIMKNPNNPNCHSRQASVKFRGSTSTESASDVKVDVDFTVEAFRSAVRYPDVEDAYKYWDSYAHKGSKPSNDS